METEIWRDIYYFDFAKDEWVDYRDLYQVSNLGRVKSLERLDSKGHKVNERILKLHRTKNGYLSVMLYKNGKNKRFLVHRLVAQAFLPNPENKDCVDHINTKRDDNRINNLRWCSYHENNCNPITRKRISEAKKGKHTGENHSRSRKIILLNTGEVFDCIRQASEKYGVNYRNISSNCRGKLKSAGKHPITGEPLVWCYEEDYIKK